MFKITGSIMLIICLDAPLFPSSNFAVLVVAPCPRSSESGSRVQIPQMLHVCGPAFAGFDGSDSVGWYTPSPPLKRPSSSLATGTWFLALLPEWVWTFGVLTEFIVSVLVLLHIKLFLSCSTCSPTHVCSPLSFIFRAFFEINGITHSHHVFFLHIVVFYQKRLYSSRHSCTVLFDLWVTEIFSADRLWADVLLHTECYPDLYLCISYPCFFCSVRCHIYRVLYASAILASLWAFGESTTTHGCGLVLHSTFYIIHSGFALRAPLSP